MLDASNSLDKEAEVAHKLALKNRLSEFLLKSPSDIDIEVLREHPPEKLEKRTAIIRSIDDSSYPVVDETGVSSTTG